MANPTITSNGGGLLLGEKFAGAEFGTPNHVPGIFGTDYIYPTHTEIDYYAAKGMSVVRLPFLWERLQHSEKRTARWRGTARLDDVVSYTTGKGLKIEIEPHNYGYGFGALIGSAQTPNAAFADLWGARVSLSKSNPSVIFRIDERAARPVGERMAWLCERRHRGNPCRRGVSQEILVPGSYWDGAWTWTTLGQRRRHRHRRSRPCAQFCVRGSSVSRRLWQLHTCRRRVGRGSASSADRDHAMGESDQQSSVPRRGRRGHRSDQPHRPRPNAELHSPAH